MSSTKEIENLILTPTNVISWQQIFLRSIFHFGPFANQLNTGIRYVQTLPKKTDIDADGDYIYPGYFDPTENRYKLDSSGTSHYLSDLRRKEDENKRELQLNSELLTFLFSHISPESLITLQANSLYNEAYCNRDTFSLFQIINQSHRKGSSKTALFQLRKYLSLTMSNKTHQLYMHELKDLEQITIENFSNPKDKTQIPISSLTAAIYISGLDQTLFEYKIEKFFESYPNLNDCVDIWDVISHFHNYYIEKVDLIKSTEPSALLLGEKNKLKPCSFCLKQFAKNHFHSLKDCKFLKTSSPEERQKYATSFEGKTLPAVLKALLAQDSTPATQALPMLPTLDQLQSAYNIVIQHEKNKADQYTTTIVPYSLDSLNCAIIDPSIMQQLSESSFEVLTSKLYAAHIPPPRYHDCGASLTVTGELDKILNLIPLPFPIKIGGISSYITLTHKGSYKDLPSDLSECYYSSSATATLFSLGYFQSKGGGFNAPLGMNYLEIFSPDGKIIDTATRLSNNLYSAFEPHAIKANVATHTQLSDNLNQFEDPSSLALLTQTDTLYQGINQFQIHAPSQDINSILSFEYGKYYPLYDPDVPHDTLLLSVIDDPNASLVTPELFTLKALQYDILNISTQTSLNSDRYLYAIRHYNSEEILRAERANLLHECLGHPSDDAIISALNQGYYSYANVSPTDVRINRILRGPCVDCAQAKLNNDPMPSSETDPAREIGDKLSWDPHHLSTPTPTGASAVVKVVDEKSGAYFVWISKSYKHPDLYDCLKKGILKNFNSFGHRVKVIHGDAEKVMDPLSILLATNNITLTCSPPEQHAQRVERYYKTATNMALAVLASLPFVVPPTHLPALDVYISQCMRDIVNSRSAPHTPNYLIQSKHSTRNATHPLTKWGTVCMVKDTHTQIIGRTHIQETIAKATSKAEIGIMMGYNDQYPTSYIFLLQNGEAVYRAVFQELPNIVNPFNWKSKPVYTAQLINQSKPPPINQTQLELPLSPIDQSIESFQPQPLFPPAIPSTLLPTPVLTPTLILPTLNTQTKQPDVALPTAIDPLVSIPTVVHSNPTIPTEIILPQPILPSLRRSQRAHVPNPKYTFIATPYNVDPNANTLAYLADMDISKIDFKALTTNVTPPNPLKDLYSQVIPLSDLRRHNEISLDEIFSQSSNDQTQKALIATIHHPTLIPILNQKAQQLTFKKATLKHSIEKLTIATAHEIDRLIDLKTARHILYKDIKQNAIKLPSTMLYTEKTDDRFTARLVPIGALQPEGTYGNTYAPTAMISSKKLLISAQQAECKQNGTTFMLADCDIVAFFAKIRLDSPFQIVIKLPDNLPHKLAGKFLELTGAMNGLKESNRLADLDLRALMTKEGFTTCLSDPCVYSKVNKENPELKCIVPFTVDDGLIICTYPPYWDSLKIALEKRYDTIKFNEISTLHCGVGITRHPGTLSSPTGPISLDQKLFITRFAENLGITHLPPIYYPSKPDFFKPSTDSSPVEPQIMQSIVGSLVHCLYTRDDARKEIVYISTKQINPTKGDYFKAVHIARYLYSTCADGPIYDTKAGPFLCGQTDASPNAHINAEAQLAVILSIGPDNAPTHSKAKFIAGKPDQNVMAAEYHALFLGVNMITPAVIILNHCGFPQTAPVIVLQDSQTCINLANAEHIPQKSKHINLQHHVIREKVQDKSISLLKTKSANMRVDLLTKYYTSTKFQVAKDLLLNTFSLSNQY
jgi:hypothetical protein